MFGKKILSIVGLLFLGSQVSKVSATCTFITINGESPECAVSGCTDSEYGYHFVGKTAGNVDKVIVEVTGASACEVASLSGGQTLVLNDIDNNAIENKSDSGSTSTTVATGRYVVLDNSKQIIDDLEEDEYCVDATSKIVSKRVENYCDGGSNGCDKYFTCKDGVCTDTTDDRDRRNTPVCDPITKADCTDETGNFYYLDTVQTASTVSSFTNIATTKGDTGTLYNCSLDTGARSGDCVKVEKVGYFLNYDATNKAAIPYIQCTAGESITCKALGDSLVTDYETCSGDSTRKIKSNGIYKQCVDEDDDNATAIDNVIGYDCVKPGDLIKEGGVYKICVTVSEKVTFDDSKSYFISTAATSAFNDVAVNDHYVPVDINEDDKTVILNTDRKKYLYALSTSNNEIRTKANPADTDMCDNGTLKSDAHEFEMTEETNDHVNYYKDNNA